MGSVSLIDGHIDEPRNDFKVGDYVYRIKAIEAAKALFEEDLSGGKCHDSCPECNARELAISALEKQIPKKPVVHGFDPNALISSVSYTCPACNSHLGRYEYCLDCGQALDWSDVR